MAGRSQNPVSRWLKAAKMIGRAFLLGIFLLVMNGCGGGYGGAFYTPNYGSYYGDYGYHGEAYPDFGGSYGGDIIVGGVRHQGHYGGHHMGNDFHGGGGSHGSHSSGRGGGGHSGGGHR